MKTRDAVKIAVEIMEAELNKVAVDINIVRFSGTGEAYILKLQDRYDEIADAIKTLQELPEAVL